MTNLKGTPHPQASPLFADLAGLPPLLIQVGSAEILHDDAVRLAEKAESAGVAVTLKAWAEMVHVWHGFAAIVPEAQEAIVEAGDFLRNHLA
ncbi:MAG: alpha/beta hydrolase [Anaerolineae bacterium]